MLEDHRFLASDVCPLVGEVILRLVQLPGGGAGACPLMCGAGSWPSGGLTAPSGMSGSICGLFSL